MDDDLKEIHQPVRLRIMAALARQHELGFAALRDGLDLSDGNLASHTTRLIDRGWVQSRRALAGDHFEVRYNITRAGQVAFRRYLEWLRGFLEEAR